MTAKMGTMEWGDKGHNAEYGLGGLRTTRGMKMMEGQQNYRTRSMKIASEQLE